jgi:uncharacterized membrane protein HdeD (DUF308 family)
VSQYVGDRQAIDKGGIMLAMFAAHWPLLLARGIVAALFGIVALAWPGLTLAALVLCFGAYAFVDGVIALVIAFTGRRLPGFGSLLIEGIAGVAVGAATVLYPGITAIVLLAFIAGWAIVTGIASIATAVSLRRELSGEWPLPVAGTLLLILGILLLLNPMVGALAVVWMIGLFAVLLGITLMALAFRMRQLSQEIARA